ncbi:MAG: hypothetical protein JWO82_534 [Akkermansiaceae bacterium]|nr:hypothetical protein [Akkermansiaceae bacterium]
MPRFSRLSLLAPAVALLCGPLARGADDDAQALSAQAVTAMDAGKWQDALETLDRCVTRYDAEALKRFGPSFGVSWYRKGVCELKLQKWEDAAHSFQKCYQDYPNRSRTIANPYNKRALLRWGEALQGAGNPAEALRLYDKFLVERDKTEDGFQPASFYLSRSLCHFATGKIAEGVVDFETAVKNRSGFDTPDSGIAVAFRALVKAALEAKDEKIVSGFINRNRGDLVVAPAEMAACVDLYLSMGAEMAAAGMPLAAAAFFGLVPDTDVMIEDLRARLDRPGDLDAGRLARFQAALAKLEEARRKDTSAEVAKLAGTALLLEQAGDVRGAFSCYQLLERFHGHSPQREEYLFQLVRTGILAGETRQAEQYGTVFTAAYPQSKRNPELKRTMLAALFRSGGFDACARAAAGMQKDFPEGSREQDACLYFLAASDYYLGRTKEAEPLIDQQVSKYPQSEFRQAALWYQASIRSRLGKRAEAAGLLDSFLAAYPDAASNSFMPYALFERASCHAAEKQWPEALAKLERLDQGFAESEVSDTAASLLGQVMMALGRDQEAAGAYRKALGLARERNHPVVAAEALLQLAALLAGEAPDRAKADKELLACADLFWRDYAGNAATSHRFALVQAEAFARNGRSQEAIERLEKAISAADCSEADRGDAAWAFARLFLREHPPERLKEMFLHFPGLAETDRRAQALLRGTALLVLDEPLRKKEPGWEAKATPLMAEIFQDLKNRFAPEDFSTALLIRTGDFLRVTTSAPRQALPYYEEVLKRRDEGLYGRACSGKRRCWPRAAMPRRTRRSRRWSVARGCFRRCRRRSRESGNSWRRSPPAEPRPGSTRSAERMKVKPLLSWMMLLSAAGSFAVEAETVEAYLAPQDGGSLHVKLTGGDRTTLRYEEISTPGVGREIASAGLRSVALVEPPGFQEAMALYGSRHYRAAREKFATVQKAYQDFSFLPDNPATLAGFQIMECLRQEGDLEELAKAAAGFDKSKLSREYQQRQFDLYAMWDDVRNQSWDRVEPVCRERLEERLPGDQRSQVAYGLGLALEAKGKAGEALASYHEAMAAATGAPDATTRQAALHAMRLHRKQPEVAAALAQQGALKSKEAGSTGSGPEMRELLALARAYASHFGAGESLPDDLKDLLPAGK